MFCSVLYHDLAEGVSDASFDTNRVTNRCQHSKMGAQRRSVLVSTANPKTDDIRTESCSSRSGLGQDKVCHANQHAPQLLASLQSSRTSDAWQSSVHPRQSSACMQCAVASTEQMRVASTEQVAVASTEQVRVASTEQVREPSHHSRCVSHPRSRCVSHPRSRCVK